MKAVEIVMMLREQFAIPDRARSWRVGDPKSGDDAGAVYERYCDDNETLFARFGSSSDAETIVNVLNEVNKSVVLR